ncbi:unnamed protein product [Paramecium primaurelia]|uniref:Uncharacterized protein n=1 Tax=Paramecium primaurelia TaxID=5886 RepID=A0A8S1QME6_PARPR|nr:unnamed protein product [Paramecium primaurelia]
MIRSFQIGKDISTQLMAPVSTAQDEYYSLYTQQNMKDQLNTEYFYEIQTNQISKS